MINFVIGPPCAGKSTFIKATFSDAIVIDLWDYQKDDFVTIENIMRSYEMAKKALIEAIKTNNKQIVFEHTLLKAKRRKPYIEAIREVSDDVINCYVLKPYMNEYRKRCKQRQVACQTDSYEILEMPTLSEGFDKIFIIK